MERNVQADTVRGERILIQLKEYQEEVVSKFERYLKEVVEYNESEPHIAVFDRMQRLSGSDRRYQNSIQSPSICIRIPTGGGKTITACHLLNSLYRKYLRSPKGAGIVMWLVPTEVIMTQTISALRNHAHPYRQALDRFFFGRVIVYDFDEAKSITRQDVKDNLCIIVTTFSTFRISNRDRRKAYEQNGNLMGHFHDAQTGDLLKDGNGNVIESLVNVIRMNRPIVVMDEGHHAQTTLSYEMLDGFKPSFVLEYTATPRDESNVLVHVTGEQLKLEDMVKMPIHLYNITPWEKTLHAGVEKRTALEKIAETEDGEYIRPIAVIQAERDKMDNDKIHVEQVRQYMVDKMGMRPSEIAVRTGTRNDLNGVDLASDSCAIRYIITVKALSEGWDNPFAYVLISVANIGAPVAVEQIIGRIMRLPNQRQKRNEDLNHSYVYTSSDRFERAASAIEGGLERHGYSKQDLIHGDAATPEYHTYRRAISDDNIKLPCIAIKSGSKTHRIDFHTDLLGSDFLLGNQKPPRKYVIESDVNLGVTYDLKEGDTFEHTVQRSLDVEYGENDIGEDRLLNWLDRNITRQEYQQADKMAYLKKVIKHAKRRGVSTSKMTGGLIIFADIINRHIDAIESEEALNAFRRLEDSGRLLLRSINYSPGGEVEIDDVSREPFERHLFERAGEMNDEELDLAKKIDMLANTKWWLRNVEKRDGFFFIQGWRRWRFYPDFIIKTRSKNYVVMEYKGEHLLASGDTEYKEKLGKKWAELAGKRYHFFMVGEDTVEDFLSNVKNL